MGLTLGDGGEGKGEGEGVLRVSGCLAGSWGASGSAHGMSWGECCANFKFIPNDRKSTMRESFWGGGGGARGS